MKRILTIQDISCLGKCSALVAVPLLSAMGHETVLLPTALLSAHTMFPKPEVFDLSAQNEKIVRHWKSLGVRFDAILIGYLGSMEAVEYAKQIIQAFQTGDTLVFVDPVMADHGTLYSRFDASFAKENASLCGMADVIVPNLTEACLMTGTEYREAFSEEEYRELLLRLAELGAGTVLITGAKQAEGMTGIVGYEGASGRFFMHQNTELPRSYPGTGDIFAAVCAGGMLRGMQAADAAALAVDYLTETIAVTIAGPDRPCFGVDFETTIPWLLQKIGQQRSE